MSNEAIIAQRAIAVLFVLAGWIVGGFTNGNLSHPLNPVGAFASLMCILISIAVSVIR